MVSGRKFNWLWDVANRQSGGVGLEQNRNPRDSVRGGACYLIAIHRELAVNDMGHGP